MILKHYMRKLGLIFVCCMAATIVTARSPKGGTYYTKINIWYQTPVSIPTTNYHKGGRIPAGSKVKILSVSHGRITFLDDATGVMTLVYARRHTRVDFKKMFDRYFSKKDVRAKGGVFHTLTKQEQSNVDKGTISVGMSKDAVLMAYGYPPGHRTPSLRNDTWTYWVDRRQRTVVNFDADGKVTDGKGRAVVAKDEKAKIDPRGKVYYVRVNIWDNGRKDIPTINYHSGKHIPMGTKVTITAYGVNKIGFSNDDIGHHALVHSRKYRDVAIEQLFAEYFSETDPKIKDGDYSKLTVDEKKSIDQGIVTEGMSKSAVLMAYGYPPSRITPLLDHHIWTYWRQRAQALVLYFRDDKVFALDPPFEKKEEVAPTKVNQH
ncbi:MAG: hypothetical protein KAH23_05940 [Kiritimatiellae bacterium]|nr:hypothetical protein [Kiritimatiellia bacterium]